MLTVGQIVILLLVIFGFYLYYLYKKALLKKERGADVIYNAGRPKGNTPPPIEEKQEKKKKKKDEDEDEKEYTYEDPNFNLSPLIPSKTMSGEVTGPYGDAIYGNEKRYYKDLYYGRVSHKAKIELVDRRVYLSQYELNIIKVKVIKNEWKDEVGRIGWIGLEDTSFRDSFDPETRTILE